MVPSQVLHLGRLLNYYRTLDHFGKHIKDKHSSFFCIGVSENQNKFYNIYIRCQFQKNFFRLARLPVSKLMAIHQ